MEDKPQERRAGERSEAVARATDKKLKFHPVYLLLLVPYVALLWVPFYNRIEPTLFGIPFFYWFQMLWIAGGTACLYPVYRHENRQ